MNLKTFSDWPSPLPHGHGIETGQNFPNNVGRVRVYTRGPVLRNGRWIVSVKCDAASG